MPYCGSNYLDHWRLDVKQKILLLVLATFLVLSMWRMDVAALEPSEGGATTWGEAAQVDWLEPQGLSIIQLVGRVPDAELQGALISYGSGFGIVRYRSGNRQGDVVTINVDIVPRWITAGGWSGTLFGCLGQAARLDQWGVRAPQSTMRLYQNDEDITSKLTYFEYFESGQIHPIRSANDTSDSRYPEVVVNSVQRDASGAVILPANQGCQLTLTGFYDNLKATFVINAPPSVDVQLLGKETFTFHSYIGPGYAGHLAALSNQMSSRFAARHEKVTLNPPAGTEYLFVNLPATPVDPYTSFNVSDNIGRASGGTYRLSTNGNALSVDHVASYGLPIRGQWQDADQAGGAAFLPFLGEVSVLAGPEYFVPAGVAYDPCMKNGGCSQSVLDAVYNTPMQVSVLYLATIRQDAQLQRIPLRQVGPGWLSAAGTGLLSTGRRQKGAPAIAGETTVIFLPLIQAPAATPPVLPDDPTGCPCGWFDAGGQMLDFIPAP
jgi:hypothetical protein